VKEVVMRKTQRGRFTERLQVCLTPTQLSAFREIAKTKFSKGDNRTGAVDESAAGRQAIIDWIRANGNVLNSEEGED